jgi:hypothetical protein
MECRNNKAHYRIRYLDNHGKKPMPDRAYVFRVFRDGEHVKDFYPLSEANRWIKADRLNHELFPLCAALLDAFEREEAAKNLLTLEKNPTPVPTQGGEDDIIDYNEFDIPNGKKAETIRQFFKEEAVTIVRDNGRAFDIEDILTDEVEPPQNTEPDEIG